MSLLSFFQNQPRLASGIVSLTTVGAVVAYWSKRELSKTCRRVPLSALPAASACRNFIKGEGDATSIIPTPRGLEKSALLSSWSSEDGDKTHWIPSFVALQVDVPVSLLARYKHRDAGSDLADNHDAFPLMQHLVAAFLDARSTGPDSWLLDDKDVPPLAFAPGAQLFGAKSGQGAFMLGAWASAKGKYLRPSDLPEGAALPVCAFPSNEKVMRDADAAGAVMYWRAGTGAVRAVDNVASYGLPWRIMDGGFQEFMVEKVSKETARVTYVTVEAGNLYPGGQSERDFKMLPWLAYELHVFYAQYLLYNAIRRLRKGQ
ncbi:hypothetical protein B0H63DRAFT_487328 [Podospora didyma]|uniref:Uncharacterized protein n=1 Tax=Podospora didyma TaxID=330526 RepID=A0AAE0K6P9_9PEZI|nr:hypothetical protein B0H63DRAFT_487328 [Podospora didyma]